jgi:nucleoside-diphosphate-sugar epimerase
MNVLVTGASGFLGGHVVDAFIRRGDRVRALVRATSDRTHLDRHRDLDLVVGDLDDEQAVLRAMRGVDVVVHSAARVADYGTRDDFYRANVAGTEHLLDVARAHGVRRFVFVSSPSVVAEDRDQYRIDESYPYPARFLNLYCETKAIAEKRVLAANGRGIETCAIRPRGVWGPRDRTGFLPKIVHKMMSGRLPNLSGGQKVWASMCFCENAAEACLLAATAERAPGNAYFVTDSEPVEVWSFARRMGELLGAPSIERAVDPAIARAVARGVETVWTLTRQDERRSPPMSRYALALLTRSATYDIRAAERDLGYRPRVDLEEGLVRLLQWIESSGGVPAFTRHVRS